MGALTILLSALLLLPGLNAAPSAAEDLFAKTCAPCHGKDGRANTPAGKKAGAKDLTVSKTSRPDVEKQIVDGKLDPKSNAKMPAFGGKLSPEEIKSLADYVLTFRKGR